MGGFLSLCLPLPCALSLTMHCSGFLAPLHHSPPSASPSSSSSHPRSDRSETCTRIRQHQTILKKKEKKYSSSRGLSFSVRLLLLNLHLSMCHLSESTHPQTFLRLGLSITLLHSRYLHILLWAINHKNCPLSYTVFANCHVLMADNIIRAKLIGEQ